MSSSSGVTTSTVNGTTRVTGLVSGIDVDSIVEELVTAEKAKKLNQLEQKEQLTEWRQEAYQDIISEIQDFAGEYFDSTSDTCLFNQSTWQQYTVSSSSSAVSATYSSSASEGNHTVTISQLATSATYSSDADIAGDVTGDSSPDYTSLSGKSIVLTLDDTDYTITFDSSVTDLDSLQDAIDDAVGSSKVTLSEDTNGYLTITSDDGSVDSIAISAPSSSSLTSGLSTLGFGSDSTTSNRWTTSTVTLEDLGVSDTLSITINGVSIEMSSDDTLDELMEEIEDADCGATLAYDETSGKLVLTADDTGAGTSMLTVSESDSYNFLSTYLGNWTSGTDAVATIDGTTVTRSSNTFTVDGVTYTAKAVTSEEATVSVEMDVDGIYDMISSFIDDYNTLISSINDIIDEDYDTDYLPLTDDQKEEMDDDEISAWEEKAKTGILEDDNLLSSFVYDLRNSLIDSISGLDINIFDIGIDTSDDYSDGGTLVIEDEDALKEAISSNLDDIAALFTQSSATYGGTVTNRSYSSSEMSVRYNEEGLGYRMYDVLSKYTSTYLDSSGNYGLMIERAGEEDDDTDDSYYGKLIDKYNDAIDDEEDRIDDYEDEMYDKYSTLENYISNMNTQLTALQSYLSSS